ncbi:MAG: hypothetical protein M1308_13800 [Actinobacteria bacterium]|nr:hypothetical protein [Actinomycetota bacterium]
MQNYEWEKIAWEEFFASVYTDLSGLSEGKKIGVVESILFPEESGVWGECCYV